MGRQEKRQMFPGPEEVREKPPGTATANQHLNSKKTPTSSFGIMLLKEQFRSSKASGRWH